MANDKYSYNRVPDEYYYEFYSEGPKDKIKKIVRYSLIQKALHTIYNLEFGDLDEQTQEVNDRIKTNNADHQKVLATVADTVMDFLNQHPKATIFAQGSTASRTKLYQINILEVISQILKT